MGLQANQIFVNLPVKDFTKSVEFFTKLGFEFNPQFTNETSTCMIIGENIFAMLLAEEAFKTFINKEIADATKTTEVIIALSVGSKEEVDELVNKALAAGGGVSNDPQDHGFMYGWSFQDLDGHLWELIYMDSNFVQG
jgi:predicted lactoylglutathione lyase